MTDVELRDSIVDVLDAMRGECAADTAEEIMARVRAALRDVRLDTVNDVYEMSPTKQFKDWKPQTAVLFYRRLKAYECELRGYTSLEEVT